MNTPGGPETSVNTLAINCDRVQVTNIEFINGGGTAAVPYYRSVNVPGTQIRVTAQLEWALTGMVGNTTIRIADDTAPNTYDVVIPNGANQGIATMDAAPNNYPAVPGDILDNTTTLLNYSAVRVYGGAYDGDIGAAEGQDDFASITQAPLGTYYVYWDSNDPPGQNVAPFTPFNLTGTGLQTPYTVTLAWTPLTAAGPDFDGDFYTYRAYYRTSVGPGPWLLVDRNTAGYANLGLIETSFVTITGLQPFTNYDYYITAIDLFGQEVAVNLPVSSNATFDYINPPFAGVPAAPWYATITTAVSQVEVTVTDGVTEYNQSAFETNPNTPADRPFRKTALKASIYIVTAAGGTPDEVNLIVAAKGVPVDPFDLVTGTIINPALTENVDYYKINCPKYAPNTWVGYIPETNPLMTLGSDIRFVVETIKGGASSFSDTNTDPLPPGNPNDNEYSFTIASQPTFTPWPTRILNNVIDDKNPVAYPAFYLSEDAYVTIKIYDIKGRPVVTLLDASFRKGGQNIKEQGWDGRNKSNRKVGVGLYYVHIRAKSASSGKVILNSFQKVVMAR